MDIGNGRYRLVRRLGVGGTSSVYQAVDRTLGRPVAVKALHEVVATDLLQAEAASLAQIDHPHTVTVYDLILDGGRPYLILEYVDGCDLQRWVAERGPLPPEQALKVIRAVGLAVGAAHRRGILHCDLKPANVLLATNGEIKLTDLTLAQRRAGGGFRGPLGATTAYAAPEQLAGNELSVRTDVYGLGVLLDRILDRAAPSPVAPAMRAAIDRATAQEPEDRFDSVDDFLEALPPAETDTHLVAPSAVSTLTRVVPLPARMDRPARSRWWTAFLACCLVLVATAGIVTRLTARAERAHATVPALVGADRASAVLVARSLDLRPHVVQAYSSLAPRGVVSAQQPRPGETVGVGSGITLTVSLGPRPLPVADVQGLAQAIAVSRLHSEGFRVSLTHSDSISTPPGTVLSQSVAPNALRVPGARITLEISQKPWWWIF